MSDGVTPSTISIQVDNKDKVYTIKHGTAGKNTEYNIVRNHIYRFNITGVNSAVETGLNLEYMVMRWNRVVNKDLTFGNPYGNAMDGEEAPDTDPQDPSEGETDNTQNGSGNVTQ